MHSTETIAYIDCFSGVSGDMFLGALIHCGLPEKYLLEELTKLNLGDMDISITSHKSQSIEGIKVTISSEQKQEFRTLPKIRVLLESSSLSKEIITKSLEIFSIIAEAEATVHGCKVEEIHFHEVGALDTIVDVVGAVIGINYFNISKLYCAALPLGNGFVDCDHGRLPLPAPAVCNILQNMPTYGVNIQKELVTPTGAAIIKGLVDDFGSMPSMKIRTVGYGAGSHTLPDNQPNLLRLLIAEKESPDEASEVEIIETNLDDWPAETFPYLCDKLLKAGALDVSLAPVQMKKGRSGFTLQVICPIGFLQPISDIIFCETTTIGLRHRKEQRITLARKQVVVATKFGDIEAKQVQTPEGVVLYPEYEECIKIADKHNVSVKLVYHAVVAAGEK